MQTLTIVIKSVSVLVTNYKSHRSKLVIAACELKNQH